MKRFLLIILFLVINFGALYLGNLLMNNGPTNDWYLQLNKAPWTPPGWVFGAAWTLIMVCFSVYMAFLVTEVPSNYVKVLFGVQFLLNVSWNYIFFNKHFVALGLISITILTFILFTFFFSFKSGSIKKLRYLLLPYMVWLCIATSLNGYIALYN